ncbi:MAG: hypothetical protein ACFFCS_14485 [Candidatus Hodarchaeota archaeon]
MNLSLINSPVGIFLLKEGGNVVLQKEYPFNAEDVASIFNDIKNKVLNPAIKDFIPAMEEKMKNEGVEGLSLEIEDSYLLDLIEENTSLTCNLVKKSRGNEDFRDNMGEIIQNIGINRNLDEVFALNQEINLILTKNQIKSISQQDDRLIMQAVNSIDDLNKSINIFVERLREWYGLHFPELTDKLIADHEFFLDILTNIGFRSSFSPEKLRELRPLEERKVERIMSRASESMGGDFSSYDMKIIRGFARNIMNLFKVRVEIENYVETMMEQACPNTSALVGPLLGARLLVLGGGLENLSRKPSSTIQVLGAEKALFRAIKTKAAPPKHGVLFQAKEIRTAPYWQRGKIARLLAGKLSIAVKVDFISKRNIADELLADIDKKIKEIQRKYPNKPPQKKSPPKSQRSPDSQRSPRYHGSQKSKYDPRKRKPKQYDKRRKQFP